MVRKESADTQKKMDMDMDVDENEDELSFVPCAVSSSARWREPRFKRDQRCWEAGFDYWDIAAVMLEENGDLCTFSL